MSIVKMGDIDNQSATAEYLIKSITNHERTNTELNNLMISNSELLFCVIFTKPLRDLLE